MPDYSEVNQVDSGRSSSEESIKADEDRRYSSTGMNDSERTREG